MKKRILIVLSITSLLLFTFIPINKEESNVETEYNIQLQVTLDSTALPSFGVQIDNANTDNVLILNEDPTFKFAFFYNVSVTAWANYLP